MTREVFLRAYGPVRMTQPEIGREVGSVRTNPPIPHQEDRATLRVSVMKGWKRVPEKQSLVGFNPTVQIGDGPLIPIIGARVEMYEAGTGAVAVHRPQAGALGPALRCGLPAPRPRDGEHPPRRRDGPRAGQRGDRLHVAVPRELHPDGWGPHRPPDPRLGLARRCDGGRGRGRVPQGPAVPAHPGDAAPRRRARRGASSTARRTGTTASASRSSATTP